MKTNCVQNPGARLLLCCSAALLFGQLPASAQNKIVRSWDVAKVTAGFPVGFSLLTAGDAQYAAYYDPDHRMTVASRTLGSDDWRYHTLPSKVGWDSHNSIVIAVDRAGHLHVTGNMHADELVYFRTEEPGDIASLQRLPMTGELENRVTYPRFLNNPDGQLVFAYRHGGSGRGNHIYNIYDPETRAWSRLLDTPLFDGQAERSSYPSGPLIGPDGWYHMAWVWRDTPCCSTNNHLSYARSQDLLNWQSASGKEIQLPIRLDQRELWVDPIPSGGGIINGGFRLSFDAQDRPLLAYHKTDAQGNMQLHAARAEGEGWTIRQLTDWEKPVEFSGHGSMGFVGIRIGNLGPVEPGVHTVTYTHRDYGDGRLFFDEATLRPLDQTFPLPPALPRELDRLENPAPGMAIRRASDRGGSAESGTRYLLQWETLGPIQNNAPRPAHEIPEPSTLRLHKLASAAPKDE